MPVLNSLVLETLPMAALNNLRGSNQRAALSDQDKALLDDFICGRLARVRDECDAAFGWNKEMRTAAGSAAIRIGQ